MDRNEIGRRELLQMGLSAGALAAIGIVVPEAAWARGRSGLITNLAGAIDKEHRAVWAYRGGVGTGKLSDTSTRIATTFMNQHKEHAEALSAVVRRMGGKPPAPRRTYDLNPFNPDLASEKGILVLALKLEADAVKAYYAAIRMLKESGLRGTAAGIFADEAMHVAVLRNALGLDPVPVAFVTDPTTWSLS